MKPNLLALIVLLALSSSVHAEDPPAMPVDPSIMADSPPPPAKRVNLMNWQKQPFNHWSFMHVEQVVRTALVDRGAGSVSEFRRKPLSLASLEFEAPGVGKITVADALAKIDCNGYLLMKDGKIVFEHYANGFSPRMRHLTQSAGKSVMGTLVMQLIADRVLDDKKLVTDYIPEMKGSAYEGATLRHVLDMTAGVKYSEDYYDPKAEVFQHEISHAWKPAKEGSPATLFEFLPTLKTKERDHGVRFEYASCHTDVLTWIVERVTGKRLPAVLSERIWSKLGAEQDAAYTVDGAATICANGGFCVGLRDFGRFGQMILQSGFFNGHRIVAPAVAEGCFSGDHEKFTGVKARLISKELATHYTKGAYSNQWWAMDVDRRDRTLALGSFGNLLYIDRTRNVVMVQLATQRVNADIPVKRIEFAMLSALLAKLDK